MVFTAAQTTSFFEDADQMALEQNTHIELSNQGIDNVDDLKEFDKESLKMVADSLSNPGGRVPNPDPAAPAGSTIPRPPFVFGAKSRLRLIAACDTVRCYDTVGRDLTPGNMRHDPIIKNFAQQCKALQERKDEEIEVPKITKGLKVMKWAESFEDWLSQQVGVRCVPLKCVTREVEVAPIPPPQLITNMPHSAEHGSVEMELVMRATHTSPLFRTDNAKVCYALEVATRGTQYAASLKPYQRTKNGREAMKAFISQFAGEDKWDAELKRMQEVVHTRVWKGNGSFTLEKHIAQHRNAYVSMTQCAEHVSFQLPNERTRVTYLVDSIQNSDPGLQAALAQVRADKAANGLSNVFEKAATHLQPYDPVAKKRNSSNKRGLADISDAKGDEAKVGAASASNKKAIGKTGVEFRFYQPSEHKKLTAEQKKELHECRLNNDKKQNPKSGGGKNPKWFDKAVASSLKAQLEAVETEDQEEAHVKSHFKSVASEVIAEEPSKKQKTEPQQETAKVAVAEGNKALRSLRSILRRSKN